MNATTVAFTKHSAPVFSSSKARHALAASGAGILLVSPVPSIRPRDCSWAGVAGGEPEGVAIHSNEPGEPAAPKDDCGGVRAAAATDTPELPCPSEVFSGI